MTARDDVLQAVNRLLPLLSASVPIITSEQLPWPAQRGLDCSQLQLS